MKTPFRDFKATEIPPDLQEKYFVKPRHIDLLISDKSTFIYGERGSGKTTALRYLEKHFNLEKSSEYVGVYFRFESSYMKSLFNQDISMDDNIEGFSQILSLILCKQLCLNLLEIQKSNPISKKDERNLCDSVLELFIEDWFESPTDLESLRKFLDKVRIRLMRDLRKGDVNFYFSYPELLKNFAMALREISHFNNTCICILFDEYENLTFTQQKVINSLVKDSSYYLTYKICLRPDGFHTRDTLAEHEQLIETHDFIHYDYVKDIIGDFSEVKTLILDICKSRLKYFYDTEKIEINADDLDIENYLEVKSAEEEIEELGDAPELRTEIIQQISFLENPYVENRAKRIDNIIDLALFNALLKKKKMDRSADQIVDEVLSKGERYKNWIHNYKTNVVYMILDFYEKNKLLCGIDKIIRISHNNARQILRILHNVFNKSEQIVEGRPYEKISAERQTESIKAVSNNYFEEIRFIPINGPHISNLVNATGRLFRSCLLEESMKKFEVNHFSIKASNQLTEEDRSIIEQVFRDAVMWGILISERSNKERSPGDMAYFNKDYILNPLLSPYFSISYRKKQKCELLDMQVIDMFQPISDRTLNKMRQDIINEIIYYKQLNLWEIGNGIV